MGWRKRNKDINRESAHGLALAVRRALAVDRRKEVTEGSMPASVSLVSRTGGRWRGRNCATDVDADAGDYLGA